MLKNKERQSLSKEIQKLASLIGTRWETRSDMARDLEISDPFLYQVLRGDRGISATILKKLARNGVDMNWLLSEQKDTEKEELDMLWSVVDDESKSRTLFFLKACHAVENNSVKFKQQEELAI